MHQLSFFIPIPNTFITCKKKKKTTFTFFSCNSWFLMRHELNQEAILWSIITIVRSSGDELPSCKVPRKLMMPESRDLSMCIHYDHEVKINSMCENEMAPIELLLSTSIYIDMKSLSFSTLLLWHTFFITHRTPAPYNKLFIFKFQKYF